LGAKHVFRKGFSCVNFSGIAKNIVRDMKYRSCAHNADAVADLMTARFSEMADRETGELPEYDLLVFAPMHEAKKEKRGYDQAELVATKFGRLIGVEVPKGVLIRTKETAVMSSLSAEERRQNLEGAFVVPEEKMEKVAGKTILLIDDVFTTGSTADACAKALKNAGAADIDIFTFAAGADYEEII
jgi:ComF family protein